MKPIFKARASGLSQIMSNPQGKTPMQKYLDMKERVEKTQVKLSQVKNPDTKTAIKMATDLKRWQAEYEELEKDKDRIVLSKTCVKHLDQWIAKVYYKRQKLLFVDHIDKGIECEKEAIHILNKATGNNYVKDKGEKLENEYITGHIDTDDGKQMTIDTKVCSTMQSFPILREELDLAYWRQGQAYMILMSEKTGREYNKHQVVKVLVNSPAWLIEGELWRLFNSLSKKFGGDESRFQEQYEATAKKIMLNHVFDKQRKVMSNGLDMTLTDDEVIPHEKRVSIHEFAIDPTAAEKIQKRVLECREFLAQHGY